MINLQTPDKRSEKLRSVGDNVCDKLGASRGHDPLNITSAARLNSRLTLNIIVTDFNLLRQR